MRFQMTVENFSKKSLSQFPESKNKREFKKNSFSGAKSWCKLELCNNWELFFIDAQLFLQGHFLR